MGNRSVKAVANRAMSEDKKLRKQIAVDSFTNYAAKLGMGTDNLNSGASYGFNPVTRIRSLMEWIHRGSWVGGVAVDVIAEDMTREGIDFEGEIDPADVQTLHRVAKQLNVWQTLRDTVAWSRLYGGCIAVMLIDGQDASTPLRLETITKNQFKGLMVLDRWMVEPSLSNLVTEFGPHLGLPKFYTITADAPALPRMKIHHSRCIRLEGIRLPYWQRMQENMWGISVLERVYDRMVAFDSATTGAAQLVNKAYIRTYKVDGMREAIAAGGPAVAGLTQYMDMMRRFQGIEGMSLMDKEDEFEGIVHNAFSGLSDALVQFGQQVSGALQIPLVRLFGQSPSGFNSGDADLRNYYDGVKQKQESELGNGVDLIYRVIAASKEIDLPDDFIVKFKSLWQLTDEQKAAIAAQDASTIVAVEGAGIIDRQTAMKDLKQLSRITGRFTNIQDEDIEAAKSEMAPEAGELIAKAGEETAKGDVESTEGETGAAPATKGEKV